MRKRSILGSIIVLLVLGIGIAFYLTHRPVPLWERYGIELILIPAGNFQMGDDDDPVKRHNPRHTVYLDGYSISKNLVTVKQYDAFCAATGHRRSDPDVRNTNWDTIDRNGFWRHLPPQLQPYFDPSWHRKHDPGDFPVVGVSWHDATAYCQWLSQQTGRKFTLPTEAQWEKAARGTDGRKYPWGDVWDATKCANSLGANTIGASGLTGTMPVGSYPSGQSPYGVLDMASNVWQWCADWYSEDYPNALYSHNPTGPVKGDTRVFRGGSWVNCEQFVFRCATRGRSIPDSSGGNVGFRCVAPELSR